MSFSRKSSALSGASLSVLAILTAPVSAQPVQLGPVTVQDAHPRTSACDFSSGAFNSLNDAPFSVGEVYGLAANAVTNRVYAVVSCSLAVIDGSSNVVITTFSVSCPLPSNDVVVNPKTNRIYVAARYSLEVFDGSTYAHMASINPGCNTPDTIGINSANNIIYVDCINDQQVSVIDGSTNTLRQTIPLTSSPQDKQQVTRAACEPSPWLVTRSQGSRCDLQVKRSFAPSLTV